MTLYDKRIEVDILQEKEWLKINEPRFIGRYNEKHVREAVKRLKDFTRSIKGHEGEWINFNIVKEVFGKELCE